VSEPVETLKAHGGDVIYCSCDVGDAQARATMLERLKSHYGQLNILINNAGVSMATQLVAARLAEYDLPVFEVRPGITATDMTSGMKEKYDALIAEGQVPQGVGAFRRILEKLLLRWPEGFLHIGRGKWSWSTVA